MVNVQNIAREYSGLKRGREDPQSDAGKKGKKPKEDFNPNRNLKKEAHKIREGLKTFISIPIKKIKKSNQAHINGKVGRLVEIIDTLYEQLQTCKSPEDWQQSPTFPPTNSYATHTNLASEVAEIIRPEIVEMVEKVCSNLTYQVNQVINKDLVSSKKKTEKKKRAGPSSSKPLNENQTSNEIRQAPTRTPTPTLATETKAETHTVKEDVPEKWNTAVGRRSRTKKREGTKKEDLFKLIPDFNQTIVEEPTTSLKIELAEAEKQGWNAADKAAALVDMMDFVDQDTIGNTVRDLKISNDGGLVIKMSNPEAAKNLSEKISSSKSVTELKITTISRRRPRIVAVGLPSAWNADKIQEKIAGCLGNAQLSEEDKQGVRPLFRRGPKDSHTTQWVIEVTPKARCILLREKVRFGILTVKCHDFIEQPRCFKCQKHGHIGRKCTSAHDVCAWCGGQHSVRNCPNKQFPPKCANCINAKKKADHPAFDKKCHSLLELLKRRVRTTEYGQPST